MNLKLIGKKCQEFRLSLGYTQEDVGNCIGYSRETISMFENGKNDNLIIFLWYITMGMSVSTILSDMGVYNDN